MDDLTGAVIGVPYSHIHTCKALKEEKMNESDILIDFDGTYNHIRVCQNRSRHNSPNVSRTTSPTSSVGSIASGALSENTLSPQDLSPKEDSRSSVQENASTEKLLMELSPVENTVLHHIAGKEEPNPQISIYYSIPPEGFSTNVEIKLMTVKIPPIPPRLNSSRSPRSIVEKHAQFVYKMLRKRIGIFRQVKKSQLRRIVRALVISMIQKDNKENKEQISNKQRRRVFSDKKEVHSPSVLNLVKSPNQHTEREYPRRPFSDFEGKIQMNKEKKQREERNLLSEVSYNIQKQDTQFVQIKTKTPPPISTSEMPSLHGFRSILHEPQEEKSGRHLDFNNEYIKLVT